MHQSIQYRRVRKSDQGLLATFCENDTRWYKYFFDHNSWIERALRDVKTDGRVVSGAFKHTPCEQDFGRSQLVGCLFLGMSQHQSERTIEFKNLILPSDEIELTDFNSRIAEQLIDKATRFCEVRGIQRVEFEVPQPEHGIVSLFLQRHFKIVSLRERYKPGLLVYILERRIGDTYNGDPFDKEKLANWILRDLFHCDISKPEEDSKDFTRVPFDIQSPGEAFSAKNGLAYTKRLRGSLWILERPNLSVEAIIKKICRADCEPRIKLLLVDGLPDTAVGRLQSAGVTVFDDAEVRVIAGDTKSSLSIPIDEEDVGGMLTVLERDEIFRYKQKPTLTYYLLSGIHAGLQLPEGSDVFLLIYCPNWEGQKKGVVGYYRIQSLKKVPFSIISESNKDFTLPDDTALSFEDLKLYKTFSDHEEVAILKCVDYREFLAPIPIKDGRWSSSDNIEDYLFAEIEDTASNSAYVDWESCKRLIEQNSHALTSGKSRKRSSPETADSAFSVFIAYNSLDNGIVKEIAAELKSQGITYWIDDENLRAGRWGLLAIQKALSKAPAVAVFIGAKGLGRYQKIEILTALSKCVERGVPVIPVLLPGVDKIPNGAHFVFLKQLQSVRFKSSKDENAIRRVVDGIK